ncbi:hypothetical protein KMW28_28255 [Flammeovirga yaeyamensis]|uniref:Glyoxalase-like domain-containing protein n=1 Tax=Flammeovirga yaeyamensis TaxID=367791 RepID=A0AAX1NEI4_9BACT|nr:hypothetical protein [Flammeovirga yaeyamensis]MBB3697291.1 hypothetical protein [Flammeovirga yaeyamensis]NMF33948.1 hypothetical protein [Flammeovirga yaeyamensis]QWG04792.1 hypothetical protein KMW28_28255 [Flammeovirga yaeyamensis]
MSHLYIQTITTSALQTPQFYQTLGYDIKEVENTKWAVSISSIIKIGEHQQDRLGLILFDAQASSLLSDKGYKVYNNSVNDFVLSPSGVKIYIHSTPVPSLENNNSLVAGNCMGISLETPSMEDSVAFWEALGFSIAMGEINQGWVAMSHTSGSMISLMKAGMCPHQFFNPSLTFFNGKEGNPVVIDKIRKLNIDIAEEITFFSKVNEVDNIIIKDPAGIGFFIFND